MSIDFFLVASFCITSILALPNHNPVARKRQAASDSSPLPTLTSDSFEDSYASASRAYASATKAEAVAESNFFRTAEPTAKAAYSSDLAAQSSWEDAVEEYLTYTGTSDILRYGSTPTNQSAIYASLTRAEALEQSQFFRTAVPTAKAALSSDLAAQSSWQAAVEEYLTYTGTSDILGFGPTGTGDLLDLGPIETATSLSPYEASLLSDFYELQTATGNPDATATAQPNLSTSTRTPRWPEAVSDGDKPVPYGVECRFFNNSGPVSLNRCNGTITKICSYIDNTNRGVEGGVVDQWMYAADSEGDGLNNTCSGAAYLPKVAVGTRNVPTMEQCVSLVYGRMRDICGLGSGSSPYDNARVNLQGGSANYTDPRDEAQLGTPLMGRLIDPRLPAYSISD